MNEAMWLIGIDDTDMPDTRGTGRLARMLAADLTARGYVCSGVTRHQLLVHPDVPYTSHNSAACVGVEDDKRNMARLFHWLCDYVAEQSPEGADPGLCVAPEEDVTEAVRRFGQRAAREVVSLSEAVGLGASAGLLHAGLGGTRDGMIGALAAVGLRATGDDGRFIELKRIREVEERPTVRRLLDAGVDEVTSRNGETPSSDETVETFGWLRPQLRGGRAVLFVERSEDDGTDWVIVQRRNAHSKHA